MTLFEELLKKKQGGEILTLEELTPEVLEKLFIGESISDNFIASLFDVKSSKITYLRRKYGVTIKNSFIKDILNNKSNGVKEMNAQMKEHILTDKHITKMSKAIVHFAFRNGPIEDMHSDSQKNITDDDMKKLNKYMVNRIAYILTLIKEDRWIEFNYLVETFDLMFGHDWDEAIPDDGGMRNLFEDKISKFKN